MVALIIRTVSARPQAEQFLKGSSQFSSDENTVILAENELSTLTKEASSMKTESGIEESKKGQTGSSRRVLTLLLQFSEHRRELTVPEMAELIDATLPTTYRYVAMLKDMQILEEGRAGTYHPTARIMPVARAAQLSNSLAAIARPIVRETASKLRETVMLMHSVGESAVCIELAECDRPMRFTFQRGHSLPLGLGASGKMALALLPPDARQGLPLLTAAAGFEAETEEIVQRGYAVSNSDIDEGVWACSVPVFVHRNTAVVLTVAGPASRISDSARESALDILRRSAAAIRDGHRELEL
jgi:DNA-binding IclR family transcriptional regulator